MTPVGTAALRPGPLYVVGVAVVALALCALANAGVVHPAVVALVALPLGPLGLVLTVVVLVVSGGVAVAGDGSLGFLLGIDVVVLGGVAGTAWANVAIVTRLRRSLAALPVPSGYRGRAPFAWDRILGIAAFVTAGGLFIALCFLAGFSAAVAGGVDVPAPAAEATAVRAASGITWIAGALAAVAGLVLWIVAATRGRAMLRWAVADLGVQAAALAGLIAVLSSVSG